MLQLNQDPEQDESRNYLHPVGSPITNSPPGKILDTFLDIYAFIEILVAKCFGITFFLKNEVNAHS